MMQLLIPLEVDPLPVLTIVAHAQTLVLVDCRLDGVHCCVPPRIFLLLPGLEEVVVLRILLLRSFLLPDAATHDLVDLVLIVLLILLLVLLNFLELLTLDLLVLSVVDAPLLVANDRVGSLTPGMIRTPELFGGRSQVVQVLE